MIPFHKMYIGEEEKKAVCDCIDSGWITLGKKCEEFEEQFAEYIGSNYAVSVDSGTSALFLSLMFVKEKDGFREGHKIAVPSLTFAASATTIIHAGAEPFFIDVGEDLCMKLEDFARYLDLFTTYVDVQLAGNKTTWDSLSKWRVVDSAHLIERDCFCGDLMCFSFHPTKNMTTGKGGMICTNSEEAYKWLKKARLHGMHKKEWDEGLSTTVARWGYTVEFAGWKKNMTDLQAVIGIEQLKKMDYMNEEKQRCIDRYNENLGLKRSGLHLYYVFVKDREKFMQFMKDSEIQCSVHFQPLHQMPAFKKYTRRLKNTNWFGDHIVSLPFYVDLTNVEIDFICQKIVESKQLIMR